MGRQRGRIFATVAALLLSGLTAVPTALAVTPAAAAAPADQAPAVNVTAQVTAPAVPITGGTLTIGVKVTLADPDDDLPVPGGTIALSAEDTTLGTATVAPDPNDPSTMTATLTLAGLGITGKPGAVLSAGLHQVDAVYTPTTGGDPTHGGVAVRVSFKDYLPSGGFYDDILWLAGQSVTGGYADGGYHPTAPVSRQAMAAFLYRAANPGMEPATCTKAPFNDVPATSAFCPQIKWLADSGITGGYADGGFHPTAAVSRQAMAAFLQRYQATRQPAAGAIPACTSAPFKDVAASSQFCAAIAWLVAQKVTSGYTDGGYHPTAPVSRQAMAAFLHRLFGAAIGAAKDTTAQVQATTDAPVTVTGDPATSQSVTLPKGTPARTGDQYLVVQPGPGAPDGALGKITGTTTHPDGTTTLTTSPATVDEAFNSYSIVGSASIQDPDVTITEQPNGLRAAGGAFHQLAAGKKGFFTLPLSMFDCDDSKATPNITVTLDLSDLKIDASFDASWGNYRFAYLATYTPKVTVAVGLNASITCTLTSKAPAIRFPIGGGLIAEVKPAVEISFNGKVSVDMILSVKVSAGLTATNDKVTPHFSITPTMNVDGQATASAELFAGASLGIKLFGMAGLEGHLGPVVAGEWHPATGCLTVDAGLKAELELTLDIWIKTWTLTLAEGTFAKTINFWHWCNPDGGTPAPVITSTLPNGTVGQPYTTRLTTADNRAGTWTIIGTLPAGLSLSGPNITGTPTTAGTSTLRIRFNDGEQQDTVTATILIKSSTGGDHDTGTIWAWGYNSYGELGNGTTTNSNVPVQVTGLTNITTITTNSYSAYALRQDGTVWAWGYNGNGQLGNGTTTNSNVPVQVTGLTNITTITTNSESAYALRQDGTIWAWGANYNGELGNGTTTNSNVPVQVTGLTNITTITTNGWGSAYALRQDGTVWAWGGNSSGQLGNGNTTDSNVPVQVTGLTNITTITTNVRTAYAVRQDDGTVWAWGDNYDSQLGNGTTTDYSSVPVKATGLTHITTIATDGMSTFALRQDGTVWAWGNNSYGHLGNDNGQSSVPVQVKGLTNIITIATGDGFSASAYAVRQDGTAWAWGSNHLGQLGNGTYTDSSVPAQITGLTNITTITTNGGSAYAVRQDGAAWAWGSGWLGNGTTTESLVPAQITGLTNITTITTNGGSLYALQ